MTMVTIQDATTAGTVTNEMELEFLQDTLTVSELIRERVYQEVVAYNSKLPEYFRGLVEPTEAEKTISGYKLAKPRTINWETQCELALEAFKKNGYLVLINNKQADSLDEEIPLAPDMLIRFLKLVPLVGG